MNSLNDLFNLLAQTKNLLFIFLVALGVVLKNLRQIPDWTIPLMLGAIGSTFGAILLGGLRGAMQGFIFAAVSVYGHQILNQFLKRNESAVPDYVIPPAKTVEIANPPEPKP